MERKKGFDPLDSIEVAELRRGQSMHFQVKLQYHDKRAPFIPFGLLSRVVATVVQRCYELGESMAMKDKIKIDMKLECIRIEKLRARLFLGMQYFWIVESVKEHCLYVYIDPRRTCPNTMEEIEGIIRDISNQFYREQFTPTTYLCRKHNGEHETFLLGSVKRLGEGGWINSNSNAEGGEAAPTILSWLTKSGSGVTNGSKLCDEIVKENVLSKNHSDAHTTAKPNGSWWAQAKAAGQRAMKVKSNLTDAYDGADKLKESLQKTKAAYNEYLGHDAKQTSTSGKKASRPGDTPIGKIIEAVAGVAGLVEVAKAAPVIGGIITVGLEIKSLIDGGTKNEEQCKSVLKRCEGLEDAFGVVLEELLVQQRGGGNVSHVLKQAKAVEDVFVKIYTLVETYRGKNWAMRCLTTKQFKEKFDKLDKKLSQTISDFQGSVHASVFEKVSKILKNSQVLLKVDAKLDGLIEQTRVNGEQTRVNGEKIDRVLEMLEQGRNNQEQMLENQHQLFKGFERLSSKVKGLFKVMVGVTKTELPRYVLLLPDHSKSCTGSPILSLVKQMKKLFFQFILEQKNVFMNLVFLIN